MIIEVEALIIELRILERHRIVNALLVHNWVVLASLTAYARPVVYWHDGARFRPCRLHVLGLDILIDLLIIVGALWVRKELLTVEILFEL